MDIVTPPGDGTFSSTDPERFVFDVDQVYKGEAFVRQTIVTAHDGASCGLEITGPGPFLVFATTTDSIMSGAAEGELYSNLCHGTRATAEGDIPSAFGTGEPPSAASTAENGASSSEPAAPSRADTDSSFPNWVLLASASRGGRRSRHGCWRGGGRGTPEADSASVAVRFTSRAHRVVGRTELVFCVSEQTRAAPIPSRRTSDRPDEPER